MLEQKKIRKWIRRSEIYTIITFYNNGRNLFIEPERLPAFKYYTRPWLWVKYEKFKKEKNILLNPNQNDDLKKPQTIKLTHGGHDNDGNVTVHIKIKNGRENSFCVSPGSILWIAVSKQKKINGHTIIFRPLPAALCRTFQKELEFVE